MSITITTATGRVIPCDAVTPGSLYPVLHIHTAALTGADAYAIFSDPAETSELVETQEVESVVKDDEGKESTLKVQKHRRFRDFTQLQSVGPSPFVSGALLIWLQRPAVDANEEETQ